MNRCPECGYACEGDPATQGNHAPYCSGSRRAPHPPGGDSAVVAALHASEKGPNGSPVTLYEKVEGYSAPDAHEAPSTRPLPLLDPVPEEQVRALASLGTCDYRPTMTVDDLYDVARRLAQEVARCRRLS